jgi:hypothetical protein
MLRPARQDLERAIAHAQSAKLDCQGAIPFLAQIRQIFLSTPAPPDAFELPAIQPGPGAKSAPKDAANTLAELRALQRVPQNAADEFRPPKVVARPGFPTSTYNNYAELGLGGHLPDVFEDEPSDGL